MINPTFVQGLRINHSSRNTDLISLAWGQGTTFTLSQASPTLTLRLPSLPEKLDTFFIAFSSPSGYLGGKLNMVSFNPSTEYRLFQNETYLTCDESLSSLGFIFEKIGENEQSLDVTIQLVSDVSQLTIYAGANLLQKQSFTLNADHPSYRAVFLGRGGATLFNATFRLVLFNTSTSPITVTLTITNETTGEVAEKRGPIEIQPGDIMLQNYTLFPTRSSVPYFGKVFKNLTLNNLTGTAEGYYQDISFFEMESELFFSEPCLSYPTFGFEGWYVLCVISVGTLILLRRRKRRTKNKR
ncbi:MAG: hypothetical protein ACFFBD_07330 [Candidatus Hodarchaeota archaeon]